MNPDSKLYYPKRVGNDFYHHYKEDIRLFGEMGVQVLPDVHCMDTHFPSSAMKQNQ